MTWLPLAAAVAAAGSTYWFCVRPMRRHERSVAAPPTATVEAQLAAAREELARLRDSRARSR